MLGSPNITHAHVQAVRHCKVHKHNNKNLHKKCTHTTTDGIRIMVFPTIPAIVPPAEPPPPPPALLVFAYCYTLYALRMVYCVPVYSSIVPGENTIFPKGSSAERGKKMQNSSILRSVCTAVSTNNYVPGSRYYYYSLGGLEFIVSVLHGPCPSCRLVHLNSASAAAPFPIFTVVVVGILSRHTERKATKEPRNHTTPAATSASIGRPPSLSY